MTKGKWVVTKGSEEDFKNAPEWVTAVAVFRTTGQKVWEEDFGRAGAYYQYFGDSSPKLYSKACSIEGFDIVAKRKKYVKKVKRNKGKKQTPKTVNVIQVGYLDGTRYTVKNPLKVIVSETETLITLKEQVSEGVTIASTVTILNSHLDKIIVNTTRYCSIVCYNRNAFNDDIIVIENGTYKTITKAEYLNITQED